MPNQDERDANVKSIEVSAKTIDDAIAKGLAQLDTSREHVDIEIIKEGKRGVFGLGSEEAIIRLTLKEVTTAPQADAIQPEDFVAEPAAPAPAAQPDDEEEAPATPPSVAPEAEAGPPESDDSPELESAEALAVECLSGLLSRMGIQAEIVPRIAEDLVEPGEDPPLVLDITGSDLGVLIGRRSETLRALQYMVRLMVSKRLSSWQPVMIDVESYRVRRRNSLQQLAQKMAERAVTSRRKVVMEAMPAYERRIIHIALRNHPTVLTKSVGSDDNRKVTIIPK